MSLSSESLSIKSTAPADGVENWQRLVREQQQTIQALQQTIEKMERKLKQQQERIEQLEEELRAQKKLKGNQRFDRVSSTPRSQAQRKRERDPVQPRAAKNQALRSMRKESFTLMRSQRGQSSMDIVTMTFRS
jgi:predicted RNase H-like nuclease (RuvC/YqgF family)